MQDETLGVFTYNRAPASLQTEILWSGEPVALYLTYYDERENQACVAFAKELFNHQEKWDNCIRRYASGELTSLANDWASDAAPEISQEEFRRRISLASIIVDSDGRFSFYFDDDNMFLGHTVEIQGTVEAGPDRADIPG